MLTLNLWIGFQISVLSLEELKRKTKFIQKMFEGLGVPLLSDELVEDAFHLFSMLKKRIAFKQLFFLKLETYQWYLC